MVGYKIFPGNLPIGQEAYGVGTATLSTVMRTKKVRAGMVQMTHVRVSHVPLSPIAHKHILQPPGNGKGKYSFGMLFSTA